MPASTSTGNGPRRPTRRQTPVSKPRYQRSVESAYQSGPPAPHARQFQPQPLIDTDGPAPETPPTDVRLAIGMVVGVHGVNGELKVRPLTDDAEQFETIQSCWFGSEEKPRRIRGVRFHGGHVLVQLAGISTREDAAAFRSQELRVESSQLKPLAEGEFFLYQVIGLDAKDETGVLVGTVVDLIETGSTDVFVVKPAGDGEQILLANVPDVILSIDPAGGMITVRLPEYY